MFALPETESCPRILPLDNRLRFTPPLNFAATPQHSSLIQTFQWLMCCGEKFNETKHSDHHPPRFPSDPVALALRFIRNQTGHKGRGLRRKVAALRIFSEGLP